ncbi:jerky protein homolog-like isoform X1 [Euwallacea fornicatus]|uniref:jerky protein homolog-like isoform X1 n=1 Tax=Euwallacea fornicatus TaxID=995702 RepID=UPI0033904C2F
MEINVSQWLNGDSLEDVMTDQELIKSVSQNTDEVDSDNDDDCEVEAIPIKMSHSEGLKALEKALNYVEQEKAIAADVLLIQQCRDIAAKNRSMQC